MKNTIFFIAIIALLAACTQAPESTPVVATAPEEVPQISAATAGETYTVQPSECKIEWIGTKVSGYHTGEVPLQSGQLSVNDNGIATGTFVLDLANMTVTGPEGSKKESNDKLLGHLKSADFFEVDKNPTGTFEITEVKPISGTVSNTADKRQSTLERYNVTEPTHLVSGNLTLKGISKSIEFPAKITLTGNTVEAIAKFNIDRTQWNIVYPGKPDDLIRNEVHLGISIKATKVLL